ncbi:MAG: 6-O-methylguanine DNA methyltransferase [Burkholderiales bacterium]
MGTKKSWLDKLAGYPDLPVVKPIPEPMKKRRGEGTIAIPSPREVDAAMRGVPNGRLATVFGIGEAIAACHKATIGCTVTTAIFAHMAAHAAEEARAGGDRETTAWWRTVKVDGELNPKYPGGIDRQRSQLQTEGHRIVQRGKRFFVADLEDKLADL